MQGFALDTNLLRYPTARRLLHGIALETGMRIFVLPEVHREIFDRQGIARSEIGRWQRKERKQKGTFLESTEVNSAIEAAALSWYSDLINSDNVFALLPDSQSISGWHRIAESIPEEVFKSGLARDPLEGDPLIIAQAVHFNVDLLSSNNLQTIEHDACNRWLLQKGWNHPLIHTPSETISTLANGDVDVAYTWFMAHATNRAHESDDDNRQEFANALGILSRGGFRTTDTRREEDSDAFRTIVYRIARRFESDEHFGARFKKALIEHRCHREVAITIEIQLNERVNAAAEKALEQATGM